MSLPMEYNPRAAVVRTIVRSSPRQHGFKRVLVTGGAGFLGAHLCRRLLELGNEVICMDNLYTSQRTNILPLMAAYPHLFEFVRHDVTDPYKCEVDEVYNLACPASPIHYQYDPIKTTEVSTIGAINALSLARQLGCKVFQASTSEVYGDSQVTPQSEDYHGNVNCVGIRACYDEGKRMAESLFFDYHRQFNINVRVARIFNTYGPGMRPNDGRVVSNFIMQALQGQDITVYGDGSQTRSFCYVDDMIDGMITLMENKQGFLGPVNLGNHTEITVFDLAKSIIELTDSKSKIVFSQLPGDDPKRRNPDIHLAQRALKWEPKTHLEEGLRKTIEYFIMMSTPSYHEALPQFDTEMSEKYQGHEIKMKQDI